MVESKLCDWLIDHADAPIRYRVARELLGDGSCEKRFRHDLLDHPAVVLWLKHLKPETPPQHRWMEHGSFQFCLENAILKVVQLGLHGDLPQVAKAAAYYDDKMRSFSMDWPVRNSDFRVGFDHILISNLLALAEVDSEGIRHFMRLSLEELFRFVQQGSYDLYCTQEEREALRGIPPIWRDRKVIQPDLYQEHGTCYPLVYDVLGLHTLYGSQDQDVSDQVDAVIGYFSTDAFHNAIEDSYGIVTTDKKKYYAMGWDPKYPGWADVQGYLEGKQASRLLFFAQYITKYPAARRTKWLEDLLICLEKYRTDSGTYLFPSEWLKESHGYAVMGSHMSFGENRRKGNWREIESTFYMQLLRSNLLA